VGVQIRGVAICNGVTSPLSHLLHRAKPRIACRCRAATTGIGGLITIRAPYENESRLLSRQIPPVFIYIQYCEFNMPFNISKAREHFPALKQDQVFLDNAGGSQTLGEVIES
jgi:hypothetical protein